MLESFVKGFFAGILFALPAGPAGILVLRYWLGFGMRRGILSTGGMALADGLIASSAAWGAQMATPALRYSSDFFRLVAGLLLIATGIGFLFFEKDEKRLRRRANPLWSFLWPAGLVVTNPGLWIAYGSLFLTMNIRTPTILHAAVTGVGTTAGVLLLWFVLGSIIIRQRNSLTFSEVKFTLWADRVTGYLLILFGVVGVWPCVF